MANENFGSIMRGGVNYSGGGGGGSNFVGTTAQWNALSTAQQNAYDTVDLTDDNESGNYRVIAESSNTGTVSDKIGTLYTTYQTLTEDEKMRTFVFETSGTEKVIYTLTEVGMGIYISSEI